MNIWFDPDRSIDDCFLPFDHGLCAHLGIRLVARGEDWLSATMPVDDRTRQPAGLLHGGATVALAETVGGAASYLCLDPAIHAAVGQEINASHIRSAREGLVTATARPLRIGSRSHVWQITVRDEAQRLVSECRLTNAILARR
jgi:uncharacterized protein (TIGR00369 family)